LLDWSINPFVAWSSCGGRWTLGTVPRCHPFSPYPEDGYGYLPWKFTVNKYHYLLWICI